MEMEKAMWLASIFGPFLFILGLWMLLYNENLAKTHASMKGMPGVLYLRSVFNMLIGLFIIREYNMWEWEPALVVTILGWVLFLRGVLTLYAPQFVMQVGVSDQRMLKLRGIIPFLTGIYLSWFAFWS